MSENFFTAIPFIGKIIGEISAWFHYRKRVAQEVLIGHQETLLNNAHIIFGRKCFVKPIFNAIDIDNDSRCLESKETNFKKVMNLITRNPIEKKRVMFILAEAGLGKTRLMQYLAFKLRMKNFLSRTWDGEKWIVDNNVFVGRLRHFDSIDKLILEIKKKEYEYILLDGFDEFKVITSEYPSNEVLKELLDRLQTLLYTYRYSKIVITSRGEVFRDENELKEYNISTEIAGVVNTYGSEVFKMKKLNHQQIKQTYKSHCRIYKKNTFIKRHENLMLLSRCFLTDKTSVSHSSSIDETSIFSNSFFIVHLDEILKNLVENREIFLADENGENLFKVKYNGFRDEVKRVFRKIDFLNTQIKNRRKNESLIKGKALDIIIKETLKKEKKLYDLHDEDKDFINKLLNLLDNSALKMLEKSPRIITNEEMEELKKDTDTSAIASTLLDRTGDRLEFLHTMIFEYFIARNIQKMEYSKSRSLLYFGDISTRYENVKPFYAHFLHSKNEALDYNVEHLIENIEGFQTWQGNMDTLNNDYESVLDLLSSTHIVIKDSSDPEMNLDVDDLIKILPAFYMVNYLQFTCYEMDKDGIARLKSNLTDLRKASKLGGLYKLWIQIEDYKQNYIRKLLTFEKIKEFEIELYFESDTKKLDEIFKLYKDIYFILSEKPSMNLSIHLRNNWLMGNDRARYDYIMKMDSSQLLEFINNLKQVYQLHQSKSSSFKTDKVSLLGYIFTPYLHLCCTTKSEIYYFEALDFFTKCLNDCDNDMFCRYIYNNILSGHFGVEKAKITKKCSCLLL